MPGYDDAFDDGQQVMEEMEFFRDIESAKECIRRHGAKLFFSQILADMPELNAIIKNG